MFRINTVRNFYVTGKVDGRQTPVSFGPRRKDGGLNLRITQRDNGEVRTAVLIKAFESGGLLNFVVTDWEGKTLYELQTAR